MVHGGYDDVDHWYPDAIAVGAHDAAEALSLGRPHLQHVVNSDDEIEALDLHDRGADAPEAPGVTRDDRILRQLRWQEEPGARRCDSCDLAAFSSVPESRICEWCGECGECRVQDDEPCAECGGGQ
jgi:hypothetical protein